MKKHRNNEKGIALLIALFALLLLSAVGLAMMFSADTETSINGNFREKQQVNYASLSGVLEARDRIQPARGVASPADPNYIPFPTDVPSTSSAQVWYIINPTGTETVAPWDASNKYYDNELCHENVMGMSGTAGVPCQGSSLPSGSTWYQKYDNSSSSFTGSYKLANPLLYKWTRIQLKTDNANSPIDVGTSTSGRIVCWDGINQLPLPASYNNDCTPHVGSVGTINLTDGGTGYNSAPHVNITGGGGSGASATAHISSTPTGQIASISVNNPGSGYTTPPDVIITGDGTNATAVATIYGGNVTAVNPASAGTQCYSTPPNVALSGGGGTGATAVAVLDANPSCIYSVTGGSCSSWKGNTYTTSASGGSNDFSASITYKNGTGSLQSVTILNGGTGYTSAPTVLSVSGHGTCTSSSTFTLGKHVASYTVTAGGSGYASAPTVTVAPGIGTGAVPTATASVSGGGGNAGQIASIAVTNGGSLYTTATVTISGGGGSGGAASASLATTGSVTSITLDNGGSGYTSRPTISFNGGGSPSQPAQAVAYLANGNSYGRVLTLTSMAMTNSGSKAMTQMEVATPPIKLNVTGALTLAGPHPIVTQTLFSSPNSQNFVIQGADQNSCGETANPTHPAIGVYDDPNNPTTQSAQQNVINNLARPANYTGSKPAPDVEDVYSALGDNMTTVGGLNALATGVEHIATNTYGSNPGSVNLGSASTPTVTVVNGDLSLGGNPSGYGILLVTGTLNLNGNFSWHGVVLVIGKGVVNSSGGGNGTIVGTMLVANTNDPSTGQPLATLGAPQVNWNGGGGNGIKYDHCWADNVLANVPYNPPPTTLPLKILSTRTVSY